MRPGDLSVISALRASGRKVSWLLPASVSFMRNGIDALSRSAASGHRRRNAGGTRISVRRHLAVVHPPPPGRRRARSARDSELSTSRRASAHFTSRPSAGCSSWAKSRIHEFAADLHLRRVDRRLVQTDRAVVGLGVGVHREVSGSTYRTLRVDLRALCFATRGALLDDHARRFHRNRQQHARGGLRAAPGFATRASRPSGACRHVRRPGLSTWLIGTSSNRISAADHQRFCQQWRNEPESFGHLFSPLTLFRPPGVSRPKWSFAWRNCGESWHASPLVTSPHMAIAIFDLDGTITHRDTLFPLVLRQLVRRLPALAAIVRRGSAAIRFAFDHDRARSIYRNQTYLTTTACLDAGCWLAFATPDQWSRDARRR